MSSPQKVKEIVAVAKEESVKAEETPSTMKEQKKAESKPIDEAPQVSYRDLVAHLAADTFWTDKWIYDDAEVNFRITQENDKTIVKTTPVSSSKPDDSEGGGSQGGGSSKTSQQQPPRHGGGGGGNASSAPTTESCPLPGGVCGWSAESTYLSADHELNISRLGHGSQFEVGGSESFSEVNEAGLETRLSEERSEVAEFPKVTPSTRDEEFQRRITFIQVGQVVVLWVFTFPHQRIF